MSIPLLFIFVTLRHVFATENFLKSPLARTLQLESTMSESEVYYRTALRKFDLVKQAPSEMMNITIYYESMCPKCRDFLSNQIMKIYDDLGPFLNIQVIPYGKAITSIGKPRKYYDFRCDHGAAECYGNKLHACAIDVLLQMGYNHEAAVFNACLMDDMQIGLGSHDLAADKCGNAMGIDSDAIKGCAKSARGSLLLNYYGDRTKLMDFTELPYILLNGYESDGTKLRDEICATFLDPPQACLDKPATTPRL